MAEVFMKPEEVTYTPLDQLDNLIAQIKNCIENKNDFVGFILIAIGIEFIGGINDVEDFRKLRVSDDRFKNALTTFFKRTWYHNNHKLLFEDFRGPIIHQFRTGDKFLLTSLCVQKTEKENHLKKDKSGKTILVLEQFFDDFVEAVARLKTSLGRETAQNKIDKNLIDYMKVLPIVQEGKDGIWVGNASGTTSVVTSTAIPSKAPAQKKRNRGDSKYIR